MNAKLDNPPNSKHRIKKISRRIPKNSNDSTKMEARDFPMGVDHVYPNGITVSVTDMSSLQLGSEAMLSSLDATGHFLGMEGLDVGRLGPVLEDSGAELGARGDSASFLRAFLAATAVESTPYIPDLTLLNRKGLNLDRTSHGLNSLLTAGREISPLSKVAVVSKASDDHLWSAMNDSSTKKMTRLKSTSIAVSKLLHAERSRHTHGIRDREIKTKHEELEELRCKYNQELDEKQRLEKRVVALAQAEEDSRRKMTLVQETSGKLQTENRKLSEQVEKQERNIAHMEDRMRSLEIRASEVEKAEISLENTKKNLESCQVDLKLKERELDKEKEKLDVKCKELNEANRKIQELESKLGDLKVQIRSELMKNDNIEKGLEMIPRLRDEIKEKQDKISCLEKELAEKAALLNSSRKSSRDLQEKLKEAGNQEQQCQKMKEELLLLQSEVATLKKLMTSKDIIVQQKCSQLDTAKTLVTRMYQKASSQDEESRLRQINKVLAKLQQINVNSLDQDDIHAPKEKLSSPCGLRRSKSAMAKDRFINNSPADNRSGKYGNSVSLDLSRPGNSVPGSKSSVSSAGSGSTLNRSSSFHYFSRGVTSSSHSPQSSTRGMHPPERTALITSRYRPSTENFPESPKATNGRAGPLSGRPVSTKVTDRRSQGQGHGSASEDENGSRETNQRAERLLSKLTRKEQRRLDSLTPSQLDSILCDVIHIGDRVSVDILQKPPKYGKKEAKSVTYSGILKFIGPIETSHDNNTTLYAGIRLDEPIGDSDGMFKGTRCMFTPPDYAKFCKLRDLDTVLDISLGVYVPVSKVALHHIESDDSSHSTNVNSGRSPSGRV